MKKFIYVMIGLGMTLSLSSCFGPDFWVDGPHHGPHHRPHHGPRHEYVQHEPIHHDGHYYH